MGLSKRQLAMRSGGIGASEIGVLAGLSKWSSPIEIYERKVSGVADTAGLSAELGNLLEEPLARIYAKRTGKHLALCDTLISKVHACALATPDRAVFIDKRSSRGMVRNVDELAGAERLLQVKTTDWRSRHLWGAPGADEVPEQYLAQVTWEMGVAGVAQCDVFVLFDRDEVAIYPVSFSPTLWEGLLEIGNRFWVDHVLARRPPPPDWSDGYSDYLNRQYPEASREIVDVAGTPLEARAVRYGQLKKLASLADRHCKLLNAEIRNAIGSAAGITGAFGKLAWIRSPAKAPTPDWEPIARELQAMLGNVLNTKALPEELRTELLVPFQTLEQRHTKQKKPYSALRPTWAELPQLGAVALEPLADEETPEAVQ